MKSVKFRLAVIACAVGMCTVASANRDVEKLTADPSNWAMQAGDMYNQRYSKLKQINKRNVGNLQVAWTFSTGVLRGHEGSPLVIGDTMFIHTPFPNKVFAYDLNTQRIKWKYEPRQDPAVIPQMCCDTVNRGVAYAEGKVFLQQADSMLVALDANDGSVIWSVKNGNPALGAVNTNAPHVFKDKVITGISGGEWGVRGLQYGPRQRDAGRSEFHYHVEGWTSAAGRSQLVAQYVARGPMEDWWRYHMGLVQLRQRSQSHVLRHG
jgi:glucose dehydrogenase